MSDEQDNGINYRNRDLLIRLEQQLRDNVQNHSETVSNLREIFNRLEVESKLITTVSGDIKGHLESSSIRWSELEKKLENISIKIATLERKQEDDANALNREKELRIGLSAEEKRERENFQQTIKTTIKTLGWVFGSLITLATLISTILGIIQIASRFH